MENKFAAKIENTMRTRALDREAKKMGASVPSVLRRKALGKAKK